MKTKKMEVLDKTRGFVKYDREKRLYKEVTLELVSKELYHLAAILQHYAGSLIFMK